MIEYIPMKIFLLQFVILKYAMYILRMHELNIKIKLTK